MTKRSFLLPALMAFLCLVVDVAPAQNSTGRWALGLHGGANYYISDYNTLKVGPGGEIFLRYGLQRYFSLGLAAGYEILKTEQTVPLGGFGGYMRLKSYPISLVGYFHLRPFQKFNPYLYLGGGALVYQRGPSTSSYPLDGQTRISYMIPAGIGFEAFIAHDVAIDLSAGFTNVGGWIDARKASPINGYVTAKGGVNFYLGSSDADDDDNDGLTNGEERRYGTNPNNADTDGDGLNDGEEVKKYHTNPLRPDTDGDGIPDGEEVHVYHTDPLKYDTDGDGLSDGDEVFKYKTDPLRADTDGDGLTDGEEVVKYHTDPLRVDTDGDGLSDWDEVKTYRTDPTNPDTDGDGLMDGEEVKKFHTDPLRADTDGGGVDDGTEVKRGTNPLDPRDDFPLVLEKGKTMVLDGVTFETGNATLTKESEATLDRAYMSLASNPALRVEIAGYTDNVGSAKGNERLSQRRADAVAAWLVKKGIGATRLTTVGKGQRDPIASNGTAEGRAKNRRIEFHVR
jgi:outer membrane protein OmpA-like peptidoglycan-associated protein